MQAFPSSLKQYVNLVASFGPISMPINRLMSIFRCRHGKMGSPFTRDNETYCTCMNCGARRQFNVGRGKMTGSYYYPAPSSLYDPSSQNNAPKEKGEHEKK
jgi:hypothetical protein